MWTAPKQAYSASHVTPVEDNLIAYDCDNAKNPCATVSLLSEDNCTKRKANITMEKVYVQVTQVKSHEAVKFISCGVTMIVTIHQCGSWWSGRNYHVATYRYNHEIIERENCEDIHRKRQYKDRKYESVSIELKGAHSDEVIIGHESTMVVGHTQYGCHGGEFTDHFGTKHYDVTVQYDVEVSIRQGLGDARLKENSISFFNTLKCTFTDLSCYNRQSGGSFYWNPFSIAQCSNHNFTAIYEGEVTKVTDFSDEKSFKVSYSLTDEKAEVQFLLEQKDETIICNMRAFSTQAANIHVIEGPNSQFKLKVYDEDSSIKNLDIAVVRSTSFSRSRYWKTGRGNV